MPEVIRRYINEQNAVVTIERDTPGDWHRLYYQIRRDTYPDLVE